ncbi:MAG: tyrosine-type recombinase/integrase [Microcoleus sp. CAN_BIN18]|nr:tyrosine-type recombinase/integrase [Microcoleus sp. CAN_BIN18]
MKLSRFGQSTPLDPKTYQQISNCFARDIYKIFLALAWYTGERPQAILKMNVAHVYLDQSQRVVRNTIIYPASNRKDKQSREIPVHRTLKLILGNYQPPSEGYLFPSSYKDKKHLSRQGVDKGFRRALVKAGLDNQGYSLYSARRGFITHLKRLGYDIKVIQKLTGHRNLNSLVRYIDVSEEQLRNAIENF